MNKLLPEHIIHAICDGLVYSIGLGILLALSTGIIVLCTRKASAKTRYNLLVSALTLFAGAVFFSFIKQLFQVQPSTEFYNKLTVPLGVTGITSNDTRTVNDYTSITDFFRNHANTIVLAWSLIVVIKAFQLMTGLQSLTILKRNKISSTGEYWEEQVRLLSHKLGIQRVVRIAASGITKVPMVIGHIKPLILLPIGLLTSLSAESIEAILVHELAHIRRRDWLVNLLVSALEVIFFFNPAVLWISSLIRTERENCCDDIAIAYTGSKVNYIDTLVACQVFQQSSPAYSLAFSGRKKPLLARVKRMIADKNSSLNRAERGIMALSLVVTLIGILLLGSSYKNKQQTNHSDSIASNYPGSIRQYKGDSAINTNDSLPPNTKNQRTIIDSGHLRFGHHDSIPASIADTRGTTNTISIYPPSDFTIYQPGEVGYPTDLTIPNADVLSRLVRLDSNLYQVNSQDGKINSLQLNGNTVAPAQQPEQLAKISRLTNNIRHISPQAYRTVYDSYQQQSDSYHDETNLDKLVSALITANIIQHKEELLSFKLSDREFIMNDTKMPDAVYQPLRKAFVPTQSNGKKGSWAWMYNFKT